MYKYKQTKCTEFTEDLRVLERRSVPVVNHLCEYREKDASSFRDTQEGNDSHDSHDDERAQALKHIYIYI
jgi:hypothetical protein